MTTNSRQNPTRNLSDRRTVLPWRMPSCGATPLMAGLRHDQMAGQADRRTGGARPEVRLTGDEGFLSSSAGRCVCGQDGFLAQDEDRNARTTRHQPAKEAIHGFSSPPSAACRCRQGRFQRTDRPPCRKYAPPANLGRQQATIATPNG
jgi:hypothetical protein